MKTLRRLRIAFSCLALASLFAGCGADDSSMSPLSPGSAPEAAVPDDRGANLAESSLTKLSLETSLSYDPDGDQVLAFFAVRDQAGNSLWDFKRPQGTPGFPLTGRNFTVALFPGSSSSRRLDPQFFELGTKYQDNKIIALVVDVSGSMGEPAGNGQTKLAVAQQAAKNFVDAILGTPGSGDLMALIEFSTDVSILSPLTDDAEKLKTLIDGMVVKNLTNFGGAFTEAVKAVGIQPGKRAVVFLTDGADTVDGVLGEWPVWEGQEASQRWQALEKLVDYELIAYTIGFGGAATGADADLQAFADQTGGRFYPAATADELTEAFDAARSDSIPAEIEALTGVTSPFVSFPNEYSSARGPVGVEVLLSFENANGKLTATSLGTYTISAN